jgi:hypothetical protein
MSQVIVRTHLEEGLAIHHLNNGSVSPGNGAPRLHLIISRPTGTYYFLMSTKSVVDMMMKFLLVSNLISIKTVVV